MDTPIVSRATLDDLAALVPLFDGYRRFYRQPSDPEGAEVFLRDRLARGESVVFIARLGDAPAGFTQLYPWFSSVRMRPMWVLNDLFVAPEARRRGVGRALLERARGFAAERGARGLMLQTERTNAAAQALYESLGWQRDEVFYSYYLFV